MRNSNKIAILCLLPLILLIVVVLMAGCSIFNDDTSSAIDEILEVYDTDNNLENEALFQEIDSALQGVDSIVTTSAGTTISAENVGQLLYEFSIDDVPAYSNSPYAIINQNIPYFTSEEITSESFEYYGELDNYGRCSTCIASIGVDLMPTTKREGIGAVKPTGWQISKYDFVDGKYLYNRCHLIGFQLTGENANVRNLITGTRYLNVIGMLPFENMVADFIKETNYHVMYRVTPVFEGDNLVATGVLMEAYSVEDAGEGICYNVFCYNVQPNVFINYQNGDNYYKANVEDSNLVTTVSQDNTVVTASTIENEYVLNTNSKKIHLPSCSSIYSIKESNKMSVISTRETLIEQGYAPCGRCHP